MPKQSTSANPSVESAKSDIDKTQEYYWTRQWQESEKQARADIQSARVTKLNGLDAIDSHFNKLSDQTQTISKEEDDVPK